MVSRHGSRNRFRDYLPRHSRPGNRLIHAGSAKLGRTRTPIRSLLRFFAKTYGSFAVDHFDRSDSRWFATSVSSVLSHGGSVVGPNGGKLRRVDAKGLLYHFLHKDLASQDVWLLQMLAARPAYCAGGSRPFPNRFQMGASISCPTIIDPATPGTMRDPEEPSDGLEPSTPSLPWRCSTD